MTGAVLYLSQPFAQHALIAGALVAVSCGLIGPFVVTRGMAFAVHGTSELAFTGAAAGLLVDNNPIGGALIGALVVASVIGALGVRERERDSAIGVILAFGLGIGVLLLGYYHGFATAATNILFGNIFGVSNDQLLARADREILVVEEQCDALFVVGHALATISATGGRTRRAILGPTTLDTR